MLAHIEGKRVLGTFTKYDTDEWQLALFMRVTILAVSLSRRMEKAWTAGKHRLKGDSPW